MKKGSFMNAANGDGEESELLPFRDAVLEALENSPLVQEIGPAYIRCFGVRNYPMSEKSFEIVPALDLEEGCTLLLEGCELLKEENVVRIRVPGYPPEWPDSEWANSKIREVLASKILEAVIRATTWNIPHMEAEEY